MNDEASSAADQSPVPLLRCSTTGSVTWRNAAAGRLLGIGVGMDVGDAVDGGHDRELLTTFLAGVTGSSSRRVVIESFPGGPVELLGTLGDDGVMTIAAYGLAAFRHELEQVRVAARTDSLTGLSNRLGFTEAVHAAHERGRPVTVAMIDLDRFKQVNDAHGHAVGDEVLCRVATAFADRAEPDDVVARLGGDEFSLAFVGDDAVGRARAFASAAAADLATGFALGGEVLALSASIGIATWRSDQDLAEAMHDADLAMYRAKSDQDAMGVVFAADDAQAARAGRTIEQLRRRAEIDTRTGLSRDHVFERDLPLAVGEARAQGRPVSVLLVDLDRFHDYNARYLYEAGHLALRSVAAAMTEAVREGDRCYRYGGEELAVILPDTDVETALEVGDRIRSAISSLRIPHADLPGGVLTASVGVASCPDGSSAPTWLVNGANVAVLAAKDAGRDATRSAEPTVLAPPVRSRS